MSLRTWPSMYGDYEFNDDDEDEDTKANFEQVKLIIYNSKEKKNNSVAQGVICM